MYISKKRQEGTHKWQRVIEISWLFKGAHACCKVSTYSIIIDPGAMGSEH